MRARDILSDVGTTMIGVILGGILLYFGGHLLEYAPCIEAWISPVIRVRAPEPQDTYRDAGKACFTLTITKLAVADPVRYEFWIAPKYGPLIPLSPYIANADNSRSLNTELVAHPVGTTWPRRYCFELPGTLSDFQEMVIAGVAKHRRHPAYLSETPLPSFVIPPLRGVT